jgi:hypothetical protein
MAQDKYISDAELIESRHRGRKYPNPFFDLANNYLPKDIKTLFKFCRNFYYTNSFLRNVIGKLTEYPITDLLYPSDASKEARDKYDDALKKHLKIKSFLIEIGLDYFTYGNCFISSFMAPKRSVIFPSEPDQMYPIEQVDYRLKKFKFWAKHPRTGVEEYVKIHDEYIPSIQNFRFVRWAPTNMDIKHNPITGRKEFFYAIPNRIKNAMIKGDKTILNEVPLLFLKALEKKQNVKLHNKNLYHFKQPTLAEDDTAWGKPIILPALKDIYYLQTLKRGNEAIALEHIVPKKAISPAATGQLDPFSQLNLGKWKGEMKEQVKKWRQDPNHFGIFPIPIQYQNLGGDAKALLLTNEMRFLEQTIIESMGVPVEFIRGGASWTGSSISLRIVENHFLTYRELLEGFLNQFVVDKLQKQLNFPEIKVRLKKFKMSDDAQSKQLTLQLAADGKLSEAKLLDEFGYNYEDEKKAKQKAAEDEMEFRLKQAKQQAEAQGKSQVILQEYEVEAKYKAQLKMLQLRVEFFQDELQEELGGLPMDPLKYVEHLALRFAYMPEMQATNELEKLQLEKPVTHSLVTERLESLASVQAGGRPATPADNDVHLKQTEAPNQQQGGTREKDKVNIREKTTGAKRGDPGAS